MRTFNDDDFKNALEVTRLRGWRHIAGVRRDSNDFEVTNLVWYNNRFEPL